MNNLLAALFLTFFILQINLPGQNAPATASLLTLQCKADEGVCQTEQFIRYDFVNGELKNKEVVAAFENDEFRFKSFGNLLYRNRYVISSAMGIFDLETKQFLGDGRGFLLDIVGDEILIEVTRTDLEGIFAFNLLTREYRKLPQPNIFLDEGEIFANKGKLSPNKKMYVLWQDLVLPDSKFEFHTVENWKSKSKKIIKGKFNASCNSSCSDFSKVPFEWIDDEKIITQKDNGEIITISIKGKIEPIVKIPVSETPGSLPHFDKDGNGNIIYYIGGVNYTIDVKNKRFFKDKLKLGHDFEAVEGDAFWTEYFYQGKSIGRVWSSNAVSYKGFLAMHYAAEGKNLGYPDGLKIWNDLKKDWITVEIDWGVEIIDWIQD